MVNLNLLHLPILLLVDFDYPPLVCVYSEQECTEDNHFCNRARFE